MTPQTFFLLMAMMFVGMAWYANSSLRDKIYCTYRRSNRTKIAKFIKMQSRYVIFDGMKKDVLPSCITFQWWNAGLIHWLFPQWVATLDYMPGERLPIDPKTGKIAIISDEVRNAMNKEEWVKSYAKGFQPQGAKKVGMLQQYMPLITIMAVVLVGAYMFMNFKAVNEHLAFLDNMIRSMAK